MRAYFTPERASNLFHLLLVGMIGLVSLRVVAHFAAHLV